MPTMVCVDGFILTHAVERIDIPDQAAVDAFLPPYEPMQSLDPADPISIGAMVGPDAFTEVRYLQYFKQHSALTLIEKLAAEFEQRFGREAGGLLRTYEAEDAATLVVAMGSINGTIKDVIDEMRADGRRDRPRNPRRVPAVPGRRPASGARAGAQRRRHRQGGRCRHGRTARKQRRDCAARASRPAGDAFGDRGSRRQADAQGLAAPAVPPGGDPALGRAAFPRPQRAGRRRANSIAAARRAASARRPRASSRSSKRSGSEKLAERTS